jgi:glycosyltransferase involved in cell wall biosynthesis
MRIVHAINSLSLGGAEVFVAQLAAQLATGNAVEVWTYAGAQDDAGRRMECHLAAAGVAVRTGNIRRRRLKVVVPMLWRRWIHAVRPDVIHAHLDQSELFVALASLGLRRRPALVRTLHNTRITVPLARWLRGWTQSRFDFTIACSPAVLASPAHALDGAPACAIPNGIALPPNTAATHKRLIRLETGLPAHRVLLLCIGSMNQRGGELQKGQDRLLRAFAASPAKEQADLVFLGDGTFRGWLEGLTYELGIGRHVHFRGAVDPDRKWRFVDACDAGVIFSRFEGLPITGLEYACAGLPMLLSAIPELSLFEGPGSVVATEDGLPAALTTLVAELPRFTKEAAERMNAYRQAYSIERCAEAYYAVYSNLLQSLGPHSACPPHLALAKDTRFRPS